MEKIHLYVWLPQNRNITGRLYVYQNGRFHAAFPVLGRGSRGPGQTEMLKNGNTPTGVYSGNVFQENTGLPKDSYGPWGRVRLEPVSGNALAAKRHHRSGLLIHSGSLGSTHSFLGAGQLRATNGCLRVSDADMLRLKEIIKEAQDDGRVCRATDISVTVSEI